MLGISPLSATLLYTKEVQWTRSAGLTRISLKSPSVAQPHTDRETYLRINAAILQNYSTSPWATNEHFIMPFWPQGSVPSLWNFKSTDPQTWEAETTIFRNDYTCSRLRLSKKSFQPAGYKGYSATAIMESDDGCQYNITRNVASDLATTAERNTQIGSWARLPWINDGNGEETGGRINPINDCGQAEETIIMSTAWYGNNKPRDFLPGFDITAYACHNNHTMASMPVYASSTATGLSVDFDTELFDRIRQPVPSTVIDTSHLLDLYTDPAWYNYIPQKGYLNRSLGLFGGASVLLGTKHRFNISEMIDDPDLAASAAQMRRRAFAEILQTSLQNPSDTDLEEVSGMRIAPEIRILVSSQIALVLCVLFFMSFCILLALMWTTQLSYRPLNLHNDPSTVLGLSALISSNASILATLKTLDLAPRQRLKLELAERRYFTSPGTLEEISDKESLLDTSLPSNAATVPVLRVRNLLGLALYILALLAAVSILFGLSQKSNLHQALFTYRANLEVFGGVKEFSPLAFTSTFLAVAVSLWWESIDNACRTLQPFIAMSSEPKLLSKDLNQTLELRRDPFVRKVAMGYTKETIDRGPPISREWNTWIGPTLEETFTDLSTNWMYTAMIQSTMDGPDPRWSKEGWSFIPLDLGGLVETLTLTNSSLIAHNVTVQTPAIRARIECSAIEEVANSSLWYKRFNESGVDAYYGSSLPDAMYIPRILIEHDSRYTRLIAQATQPSCCGNSTEPGATDEEKMTVLAYWTENWLNGTTTGDFTIKWLRGPTGFGSFQQRGLTHLYFSKPPSIQAVNCIPTIETASARAVVDQQTGNVRDFQILEHPVSADVAWSDAFQFRNVTEEPVWKNSTEGQILHHDVTTSYGVLFMKTLLRAASLQYLGLERPADIQYQALESQEKFFNMKDNTTGFNVDFMSHASYAQAGLDPNALLDSATLIAESQKVFSTFFQHYVGSSVSLETGGWAYQPVGSNLKVKEPFSSVPQLLPNGNVAPKFEDVPLQNTSRTVSAELNTQVPVLRINPVAFWLAAAIMAWLLVTLLIFTAVQRRYLGGMKRNIECMADVLVLVAGSEQLLQLIETKGVDTLMKEDTIHTRLGWFRDDDGTMRWRIDVADHDQILMRPLSGSSAYVPVLNPAGHGFEDAGSSTVTLEDSSSVRGRN
ncbi:hypothetical protein C7974DRAFT_312087 [Boeremia exigua]|uniref:uncharacterized protein n=1 Tax=Boeremia exigua TaxID=749465 RepID=UPI001E8D61DA|nr:uncharacterized protein C7974DRAFT_312087 [Boeremia exigua]KAH6629643.1 hypothetical protein C7974DRAFT_312087 [Boeremia exigua]